MRLRSAAVGGIALAWREWHLGGSEALVLLHGFLDQAASFRPLVDALAARGLRRRVFALDFRGHGRSGWNGPAQSYHFPEYVGDLDGWLEHLEREGAADGPIDLLGHSMGGTVACYYAGTWPERVRRLILVEGLGPPSLPFEEGPERLRVWREGVRRYRGRGHRVYPDIAAAAARLREGNPRLGEALALELASEGTRPVEGGVVWRFDPRHKVRSAVPFHEARLLPFLERITAPVLSVEGSESGKVPEWEMRRRRIPRCTRRTVEGAGHMVHHDAPEALAAVVTEFLGGAAPGAAEDPPGSKEL